MKKEDFLNKLRKNTHVQFDMPAVDVKGIQYEDTLKQFIEMPQILLVNHRTSHRKVTLLI